MNRLAIAILLVAAGALVGCNQIASMLARPGTPVPGTTPLKDIQGVRELQARFAQDGGKVRLVLLVSPT